MSQTSEIPASAYTPEMETLGMLPDIPTFDGKPVPVSRNPLTSGTRSLQLLPFPGTEFPVRYETSLMRGFQAEVDLEWAYEYRIYPGGPSSDTPTESRRIPRYLAHYHHTYASGEDPEYWRSFLNDRELSDLFLTPWDCDAWRTYPGREVAELHTRSRFLMRGYWADWVPHAPPRHMCLLEGLTREDLEERKTHKTTAHYRAEAAAEVGAAVAPARPAGIIPGDVPFPLGMEVVLDPDLGLGSGITIPADLRLAPPLLQLDPEHATHVPAQRYLGVCQRFSFARSYIAQFYSERHETAEVDRLRTRLEVEGIPLDSSDEDDNGSSNDAPPSPPPQSAAGPSRRRR
ncbi:hypothetical protein JCGZ_02386 [Jatropha curcas]|uniref:Aminotransferase-like plant mobile domain-containing protein n=1 Tax=Jatropha curcas TaxID=180498 RepID=A0A067JJ86_JATCU|nr:hypothetical protein JCGZ_02386 [Jatropha curcas]